MSSSTAYVIQSDTPGFSKNYLYQGQVFCTHNFVKTQPMDNVQVIQHNNRVDVHGHLYVFGPTQAKISSEKGQKHIYAQEHLLYYYF